MELVAIILGSCSLPALVVAVIAWQIARRSTPRKLQRTLESRNEQLDELEHQVKQLRTRDMPDLETTVESYLEQARGVLQSVETKRRRIAAKTSRDAGGNGADSVETPPWTDPALPASTRRQMLESFMNRKNSV